MGTTATSTLTVANNGNSPLTVTSISYPTGFTGSWAGTPDLFVRWLRGDTVVASGSTVYTVVRADRNADVRWVRR